MAGPTVQIKILADASQATSTLQKTGDKVGGALSKAALPAALVGGAVLTMGKKFADAASETQQAMGAVQSVFGKSAGQVQKWAEQSATSVGLATSEYSQMASVIGSQLKNMGLPQDQVLGKTKDLIAMGADLAATYGGTTAEAVAALSSALRGETDPIERYGVSVKQAGVQARMAADGTSKLTGTAGKAAQTNALLALVTEQTAAAHGQFARESTTAAGAQERATAQMKNASAVIGTALLPAMATLGTMLGKGATFAQQHAGATRVVMTVVLGLASAILVLNYALKAYRATQTAISIATKIWTAEQWGLNAAMSANPIGFIILGIVALIAVVILAYRHSEKFRNIVQAAWRGIAAAAKWAWTNVLQPVIGAVIAYVRRMMAVYQVAGRGIMVVLRAIGAAAVWLWKNGIKPAIDGVVWYFQFFWRTVASVKDKVVGAWRVLWTTAVTLKDKIVAALGALASAAGAPFKKVEDMISSALGWLEKLLNKITGFKIPKWLTSIMGKVGSVVGLTAGPAYQATPKLLSASAGAARSTAATPAAASSGAAATMNRLTGAGAQVIVQVSDRRMVDLVNVQLRDAATSAARDLTRRQVVIV